MFTHANLAASVKPGLIRLTDFTKLSIFHSRYVKIKISCKYRKTFQGSLKTRQETEQLLPPKTIPVLLCLSRDPFQNGKQCYQVR